MASRSLNKVQLIGNLTRDPELRYTPAGTAVCTMGLATNRYWTTDSGEKKEEVEFHRLVAWNKLAELCSQLLVKGRKIYVEGRLQTRSWQDQQGATRSITEIVIDDMIILDSKRGGAESGEMEPTAPAVKPPVAADHTPAPAKKPSGKSKSAEPSTSTDGGTASEGSAIEDVNPDDIPF